MPRGHDLTRTAWTGRGTKLLISSSLSIRLDSPLPRSIRILTAHHICFSDTVNPVIHHVPKHNVVIDICLS